MEIIVLKAEKNNVAQKAANNKNKKKKKDYVKIKGYKVSKLNLSIVISTFLMLILSLVLMGILFGRKEVVVKAEPGSTGSIEETTNQGITGNTQDETVTTKKDEYEDDTTEELETLEFDADHEGNDGNTSSIKIKIGTAHYWEGKNNNIYIQYRIRLTNVSKKNIENWGFSLHFNDEIVIYDYWNSITELDEYNIRITPSNKTHTIEPGQTIDIGIIVGSKGYEYPSSYSLYLDDGTKTGQLSFNKPTETTTIEKNTIDQQTTTEKDTEDITTEYENNTETTPEATSTDESSTTDPSTGEVTTAEDDTTTEEQSTESDTTDNISGGSLSNIVQGEESCEQ